MIEIKNLFKKFENKDVLTGVDLNIDTGETIVIIGRSGCGKSVLLKHIVGLLFPDNGTVTVDGNLIDENDIKLLYNIRRRFGFLFQGAALFDSMTVGQNIALPLVENNYPFSEKEIAMKVSEKLEMVDLPGTENIKPAELSGGMKKRVGLARALVTDPDYMLYDEPTTGLDPIMSDSIDDLIKSLCDQLNVTSIVVTHDMFSVTNVAQRVAMMNEGKIYFSGTAQELMSSEDDIIKKFISRTNSYG